MLPSFPSNTFPNHYAIVTGLYPDYNGIVDNAFCDPTYTTDPCFYYAASVALQSKWWWGEPVRRPRRPLRARLVSDGRPELLDLGHAAEARRTIRHVLLARQRSHHNGHAPNLLVALQWQHT